MIACVGSVTVCGVARDVEHDWAYIGGGRGPIEFKEIRPVWSIMLDVLKRSSGRAACARTHGAVFAKEIVVVV